MPCGRQNLAQAQDPVDPVDPVNPVCCLPRYMAAILPTTMAGNTFFRTSPPAGMHLAAKRQKR